MLECHSHLCCCISFGMLYVSGVLFILYLALSSKAEAKTNKTNLEEIEEMPNHLFQDMPWSYIVVVHAKMQVSTDRFCGHLKKWSLWCDFLVWSECFHILGLVWGHLPGQDKSLWVHYARLRRTVMVESWCINVQRVCHIGPLMF